MRIALRADASRTLGLGHLRRCLALAHALAAHGATVLFVTRDLGLDSASMVQADGFRAIGLPASTDLRTDASETVAALRAMEPETVIVDSYAFGSAWHRAVREGLRCRIGAIADMADRPLAPDLLIDHNFAEDHRAKYRGRLAGEVPILGGPRFALLGPAYADAKRYDFSPAVGSVGVFMGGTDEPDHSTTALAALDDAGYDGPVEVVVTGANPNLPALRAAVSRRPQTRLSLDLPDLAAFFARHDLQIGAGGGAAWERCCIGVPTLLVSVAGNQDAVVPGLARLGAAVRAGSSDRAVIASGLRELISDADRRRALAERSRELVDGRGSRRVAARLLADELEVRPATLDDAELMHRWRNDWATRAVSRNRSPIPWRGHVEWLERALADPERSLLVGQIGEVPVGVIRFDRTGRDAAEVSLYLDPALHGLGLGRRLLLAGESLSAAGLDIVAEVVEGNAGSARLFEAAGYRRLDATHWIKPAGSRT